MNYTILEEVGFTRSEVLVYEALLELGQASTGPIVERSKVSSSKIYEILDKLIHKGLVSYVHTSKVKQYQAAPPKRILDYIEEREKQMAEQKKEIQKLLPQLELKQLMSRLPQSATIYRGFKGMETAFNDALSAMKKGDVVCVANVFRIKTEEDIFFKHWNARRAKKGVRLRMILDEKAKGQFQSKPETNPLSELRWLPPGIHGPTPINVYRDRVILFMEDTVDSPLLVVVWSKAVVESFQLQFDLQWKAAKNNLSSSDYLQEKS